MATKLMPNRMSELLSKETIEAYKTGILDNRKKLSPNPVISDDEMKTWDKLGEGKRPYVDAALKILKEHGSFLVQPLSTAEAELDLQHFDGLDELIKAHQDEITYLLRRKTLVGAESLNMVKVCEEEAYTKANQGNLEALAAKNKLEKVPRVAKSTPKPVAKSDKPTPV